jgi:agmatinase
MYRLNLAWARQKRIENAEWVIFGVPDDSGSHSYRKGAANGPDRIRSVSVERGIFVRNKVKHITEPQKGELQNNIFDYGNIKKEHVRSFIREAVFHGRKPIILGGDHSITFEVLKAINDVKKDVAVVYLDAHPDFVCSSHNYYGSVMCDVFGLHNIHLRSSVEVGVRAPEKEELKNLKKQHLRTITPLEIIEKGIQQAVAEIKKKVGNKEVYLSIDMDVLDPAFAPGVSTPVPGGLSSKEFIYLIKKIAELDIIGFDIMEVTPKYDVQDMTAHLAATAIEEIVAK